MRVTGTKGVKAARAARKELLVLPSQSPMMMSPSMDDTSALIIEPDIFSPTRDIAMQQHGLVNKSKSSTKKKGATPSPFPLDADITTRDAEAVPITSKFLMQDPASSLEKKKGGSSSDPFGKGVFMMDKEIVELLRKPPKSTPALRTKGSFQDFFKGISSSRIKGLLEVAYGDIDDTEERAMKVNKRMELLKEVLIT